MRRVPQLLADAVAADQVGERRRWLAALPDTIERLADEWELRVGEPYEPGGTAAWIAPAEPSDGPKLALKVGWRHFEAEHEAEALRLWNGDGAVRWLAAQRNGDTAALLLERCVPGLQLSSTVAELEQDVVIAAALRRIWAHHPVQPSPFRPLQALCEYWADALETKLARARHPVDAGLLREALRLLLELPVTARRQVLLATDLHAENVLSAQREPWLAIDPKPFFGDPAFDPVQHMLNCDERLAANPVGLAQRMADLLELDPDRVRLWLFARCAQESLADPPLAAPARTLAT